MTTINDTISSIIKQHRIVLFMKGNPDFPQCGFSFQVAHILKNEGIDFHSVNVLEDEEIRQGIKDFSDWPTIPQLYIDGEFIGGCDITKELHENGELAELLKHTASTTN